MNRLTSTVAIAEGIAASDRISRIQLTDSDGSDKPWGIAGAYRTVGIKMNRLVPAVAIAALAQTNQTG